MSSTTLIPDEQPVCVWTTCVEDRPIHWRHLASHRRTIRGLPVQYSPMTAAARRDLPPNGVIVEIGRAIHEQDDIRAWLKTTAAHYEMSARFTVERMDWVDSETKLRGIVFQFEDLYEAAMFNLYWG